MELSTPNSHQIIQFLAAATTGAVLLGLSGLTLTATFISLVLATPMLVFFSPILVPAGIFISLVVSGFIFSGGCGAAAFSALSKTYNYVAAGTHPLWLDQLDYGRMWLASTAAGDAEETAKEDAQEVETNEVQDATQAS